MLRTKPTSLQRKITKRVNGQVREHSPRQLTLIIFRSRNLQEMDTEVVEIEVVRPRCEEEPQSLLQIHVNSIK